VPQGTTDVANGVSPTWQFFVVVMKTQGELGSLPELRQATVQPVSDSPGRLRITGPSGFDNDVNADNEPDVILPGDTILTRGGRVVRVIAAEDDEIVVNAPDIGNPGLIYYGRTFGEDKSVGATDFLNEGSPIVRVHSFTMRILEPR